MNHRYWEGTGRDSSRRDYDGNAERYDRGFSAYAPREGDGGNGERAEHSDRRGEFAGGRQASFRDGQEDEIVGTRRGGWGGATLGRSGLGGGMGHSGMATFGWSDFDAGGGMGGWRTRRAAPRRGSSAPSQASPRQDHFGRGPKGYRRSDARIQEDVSELLKAHYAVDASDIEVSVQDGVVTLSGTVSDRRSKRMAERCIEDVSGVDDVTNQVRVSSSRADAS